MMEVPNEVLQRIESVAAQMEQWRNNDNEAGYRRTCAKELRAAFGLGLVNQ